MTTSEAAGMPSIPFVTAVEAGAGRRFGKRIFDFFAAALLLLLALPLFLAVGLLIRLTSPGPAFFKQTRIGRFGRPFVMYKFRTMQANASDALHREYVQALLTSDQPPVGGSAGLYKLSDDPRITRVGRFLRRTSIDELPQLINVLRGNMSLVGPRPALPWETELFPAEYRPRFSVRPGLTGLWQVSGRNALTMRAGLDLDVEYVRRQSFFFDLAILFRTVWTVLTAAGAS